MNIYNITLRCNNNGCLEIEDGGLILTRHFKSGRTKEQFYNDVEEAKKWWETVEEPESDDEFFEWFTTKRGYFDCDEDMEEVVIDLT